MWIFIVLLAVISVPVVIGLWMSSQKRTVPKRLEQDDVESTTSAVMPEPGSHKSPHRPDGSPLPGSEEDRNRHGKL